MHYARVSPRPLGERGLGGEGWVVKEDPMPSRHRIHDKPVPSCDTAVALADTTAGGVLLAKNSDRSSHEAQRLIGVPVAQHDAGTTVRCQYLRIPQVVRTAALIGSQPYWL